jgi:hypothetical protein
MGEFIMTILIRLILYIGFITLIISSPQPFPAPLKEIARDFFILFNISI